jgi:hypothetical protein
MLLAKFDSECRLAGGNWADDEMYVGHGVWLRDGSSVSAQRP